MSQHIINKVWMALFISALALGHIQCQNEKNSPLHSDEVKAEYKDVFFLKDCIDPLLFKRDDSNGHWELTGKEWFLGILDIKSLDEVNEGLLQRAKLSTNALYKKIDGSRLKRYNVDVGDFVIAKNKARTHRYYVIHILGQKEDKISIDYQYYRAESEFFYTLSNKEKLKHCILYSDLETLEQLVKNKGGDLNVCEKYLDYNSTPLTYAMETNKQKAFDKLIELGADVNHLCRGNRTALMQAARRSDTYYFKKLLESGADISIQDEKGKTVRDYLNYYKNSELLALLE